MANPKVSINQTPAEQAVAKAVQLHTVTDANGRIISLKKPGPLAQFRLIEALGDTAKNEVYVSMALPLIFVASIDGDHVMSPTTKREVEALIQRLDDEGISAVMNGVKEHFGSQDPEADKAALKNS